jgi:hypothetical protein
MGSRSRTFKTLEELWNQILEYGYQVRYKKRDGLRAWSMIKSQIPDLSLDWTAQSRAFYKELAELGVNTSESSGQSGLSHRAWERDHYLLQHGRIIKMNPRGSLVRFLQIAYNAGQFKAELERANYPGKQLRYYIIQSLNRPSTYIADPDRTRVKVNLVLRQDP